MKKLHQAFKVAFQYDVHFTRALFSLDNPLFQDLIGRDANQFPAKMIVVIDQGVAQCHAMLPDNLKAYCSHYQEIISLCGEPVIVPGGEAAKNDPALVDRLLHMVNKHGIDRHSYIVAIGGGAVLDLVGYAAAIAHRGIRHIRIPTTVLSQNDSGVGVKNGINFFGKKNFLGTFAPPVAVINDLHFLHTLDDRDWRAGISEAVKVSLIKDGAFFRFLEQQASALGNREEAPMAQLIFECARLHMAHIAGGDPFEMGSSRPLDFGHWAAHKLEQMTDYRIRHGEAVAIGIALDATYSFLRGMIDKKDWNRIIQLLLALNFRLFVPELEDKNRGQLIIVKGLEEFREHLGGRLTIMLLEDIGRGCEVHEMDGQLIGKSIQLLKEIHETAPVL